MALITKIEVSNFLNTLGIEPWDKDWFPHWPHMTFDLDGENTITMIENGGGKTRLCDAIFAILTRDRALTSATKKFLASSKNGASSHIRMEVKQQLTSGDQLFAGGAEYYVLGCYGCYDTEVTFYLYQGQLTDCPIVSNECNDKDSLQIRLVEDKAFKESLKKQRFYKNRNRSEYLEIISLLFDTAFISLQLEYHKSGGGDGTASIFELKLPHPKGQEFNTSFFYEHIAPHLLVDVMGSFAEDDEKHFVDTLVKSSRKVINLEYAQELAELDRNNYHASFTWLNNVNTIIRDYQDEKTDLHEQVNQLNHQLSLIDRITSKKPLGRLASPVYVEALGDNQVNKQLIANQLSFHDGEWLISDVVLSQYFKFTVSRLNETAASKSIIRKKANRAQVIEISMDQKIARKPRGNPSNYYNLDSVSKLLASIGESNVTVKGGKDHLLRSLNYGFEIRNNLPSPNPAHDVLLDLKQTLNEQKQEKQRLKDDNTRLATERQQLQNSIQKYELNEQAYIAMSESTFFTKEELANPNQTHRAIETKKEETYRAIEALENERNELSEFLGYYRIVKEEFGDRDNYIAILGHLEVKSNELKQEKEEINEKNHEILNQLDSSQLEFTLAQEKSDNIQKKLTELSIPQADYSAVKDHYTDNELAVNQNLKKALQNEWDEQAQELATHQKLQQSTNDKITKLEEVKGDFEYVISIYDCDDPSEFLYNKQNRQHELANIIGEQKAQQQLLDKKIDQFPAANRIYQNVIKTFTSMLTTVPLKDLKNTILQRLSDVNTEVDKAWNDWAYRFEQCEHIEQFEIQYDENIETVITSINAEYEQKAASLQDKRNELETLHYQYLQLEKDSNVSPSRLVTDVHTALNFTGETVHQVITSLNLGKEKLLSLLVEFASILHAPVTDSQEHAVQLLQQLIDNGKDYPVFHRKRLIKYCSIDKSEMPLVAHESLEAKVIADKDYLPELLERITRQMEKLRSEIKTQETKIRAISPTSDHYQWLLQVQVAYKDNAKELLIVSGNKLQELLDDQASLKRYSNTSAFLLIETAIHYEQAHTKQNLNTLLEQHAITSAELVNLESEQNGVNTILSPDNISSIQNAIRYVSLGGHQQINHLKEVHREQLNKQKELEQISLYLKEKTIQCLDRLPGAQSFVKNGGTVLFDTLTKQLADLKISIASLGISINEQQVQQRKLSQKLQDVSDAYQKASGKLLQWQNPLQQASTFLLRNGAAFYASYESIKNDLTGINKELGKKLKYNFAEAQFFVNVKDDADFNKKLINKIDNINFAIAANDTHIAKLDDEITINQDAIPNLIVAAKEYQQEYVKFISNQQIAIELKSYLQTSLDITHESVELNSSTKYAADIEAQIRHEVNIANEQTSKLYLSLFEAIEELDLESAHNDIAVVKQRVEKARNEIISQIKSHLDSDNVIRESEKNELNSTDIDRVISAVSKLTPNIEQTAIEKDNVVSKTATDVKEQKQRLSNSMVLLTNTLKENLKLMKSSLAKGASESGFIINANIVSDEQLQQQIENMICAVRIEERRFIEDKSNPDALMRLSEQHHIHNLQMKLKQEFNQSIFVGSNDNKEPSIKLIYPKLRGDRQVNLSSKFSTGQKAAIGLLLMVKLAIYNSERVNNASLAIRTKRNLIADRVVIIDGLFSNLSKATVIREALDTVINIKDDFQIIGWLHNSDYKNDFEIFPRFYNVLPMNRKGILQANEILPNNDKQMTAITLQSI